MSSRTLNRVLFIQVIDIKHNWPLYLSQYYGERKPSDPQICFKMLRFNKRWADSMSQDLLWDDFRVDEGIRALSTSIHVQLFTGSSETFWSMTRLVNQSCSILRQFYDSTSSYISANCNAQLLVRPQQRWSKRSREAKRGQNENVYLPALWIGPSATKFASCWAAVGAGPKVALMFPAFTGKFAGPAFLGGIKTVSIVLMKLYT